MENNVNKKAIFDPKESIGRAKNARKSLVKWRLESEGHEFVWSSRLERVNIIRAGIPYASIDVISKRMNVSVKDFLHIFGLPQTTYNKKRREKSLLNGRDSEMILLLTELFDFGIDVFNNEEEKFQRWMKKQNISLGGNSPESLLDSTTGIQEVKNCLNRIEYGNFA
uniref:type II RES/Xre toxin-antitoxin system antitoxin n=2 Tax=Flavobacterium sp. TaxID=239 RepID=UPI0040497FC5